MRRKNLPIRIFSKRENIDECYVEGMGSNELPKWALSGEFLQERSQKLSSELVKEQEYFNNRRTEYKFIPLTVTAKITEDAVAKSYRKKIANIFNVNKKNNLIGMVDDSEIIVKIDSQEDLKLVKEQVEKLDKNIVAISAIEDILKFKPFIQYSQKLDKSLKVKLINYDDYELNRAIESTFERMCIKEDISFKKTIYSNQIVVYKITNINLDSVAKIENFDAIYSIEDMPIYDIYELGFKDDEECIEVKNTDSSEDYPIVGVLDDGIESNIYLKDWILNDKNQCYIGEELEKNHGTFVAGIISYGDELEEQNYTGVNGCKVFDATVFSQSGGTEQDDLIANIEECLRRYSDKIKVWNLSIGTREEADVYKFSDMGIALDTLQDKYGVLICKSAGNCDAFKDGYPKSRISKSADSVRSMVVGSIAHKKDDLDLAGINYPSPFTRIGRGPNFIIKPDLVHYGGNAGIDDNGNISITGVKSFSKQGNIVENIGTSFSTPRVSTILAGIQHQLKEDFDPVLVKALAIHSAKYPDNVDMPTSEKLNQLGFGVPDNVNNILHNYQNEITLVMRDRLPKGEFTEILDFPYPKSLIEDDFYYGQMIITVVYNPVLDASQGAEYCQSDLKIYLGTYDEKEYRDITKPYIKNSLGKKDSKNILNQSCYSKKELKNTSTEFSRKEKLLVQYGEKYYPIKKYAIDLDDMTASNKIKCLSKDRNWFLKIEGLYREAAERKSEISGDELYQDFCVIVTIRDNKNKDNHIYNEVSALLDYHNFYHSSISLRNKIDINVDSEEEVSEIDKLLEELMGDWDEHEE